MPCARGINCFLSTNHGKDLITEYPHPEGTSVGLGDGQGMWRYAPLPRTRSDGPSSSSSPFSIRGTKTNPTASVYVPSSPGSPFSIHYQIDQVPPIPCRYIFFKVHINGRQIVAWGVDITSDTHGRISLSLWLPGPLYDGMPGVEKRNLIFLPGQENKSIAEDGGLIEIQAFRASARHSRAPVLDEFRYYDNYGVATPSIGLIPSPQSVDFHSYTLIDPKDIPYATFRLHYRSEQSLRQLNLIPDDDNGDEPPLDDWNPASRPPRPRPRPQNPRYPHPGPSLSHAARPSDDVFAPEAQHHNSGIGTAVSLDMASYRFRPLPDLPGGRAGSGREEKSAPHYGPYPNSGSSPTPSLTESLRELLQTGELNPEDAVFVAPVGVVANPYENDGSPGPSVLVMGETEGGGAPLDRGGLTEEEGRPGTPPLRWARKQRKGKTMGSTGSPVRKSRGMRFWSPRREGEGLFSGLFGRGKGKGKGKEKAEAEEKGKGKEKVEEETDGWGVDNKGDEFW